MNARAASETAVANLALLHLKQPAIADLTTGADKAARTLRLWFGNARDTTLRAYPWNFAKTWVVVSALDGTFPGTFTKRYPLPENYVAVQSVAGADGIDLEADAWEVVSLADPTIGAEIAALATDATAPTICYTRRVEAAHLWDALFVDAFALFLAARCAPTIEPSISAPDLETRALALLQPAQRTDAREKARSRVSRTTSWIEARR